MSKFPILTLKIYIHYRSKCLCGRLVEFHTEFDSVPLFSIFLYRKRNEVIKHDRTQTAVERD
jgi:hypothetical protein